jgi:hypothetical protein
MGQHAQDSDQDHPEPAAAKASWMRVSIHGNKHQAKEVS